MRFIKEHLANPILNPNQQVVLECVKRYYLDDSDFLNTISNYNTMDINGVVWKEEEIAFRKLNEVEHAQVIQAFSAWVIEQEGE
ncbi:hypothetical protein HOY36_12760 [Enterococcus sp. MMGLQ5-2]|nr:hypothetical protein [Enterococcus sp. MMGLQ5-2]MBS7585619.1 hypothetical protein [Enterococcus sp. MMGLQ5-1]NPD13478.1 hypothetical protein [Enterococcus sp. MMGLQ5-1]NPD38220.1 hypothetical protein [Enterococcus sp. MMGLQ5-2]